MQNEMPIHRPEFIEPIGVANTSPTFLAEKSEPIPTSPKGPQTPTKSRSQSPFCHGAPVRPHRQLTLDEADIVRPPSLVIPSVADHRGKGILPDYFIKPEPAMPLWEKRKYILSELERWFTSPLFHQHVTDAAILDEAGQLGDVTNWPAGIVYAHHKKLAWDNNYADTCVEVYERCAAYLSKGGYLTSPLTRILDLCTLSDGKMILDYWETSDLDGLRNAPPLPENDSSDVEDENCSDVEDENCSEEEEEMEEEAMTEQPERVENFKITVKLEFTMATLLFWLVVWAFWLMINTYVLCKKYSC
jgi:hypothetical protein